MPVIKVSFFSITFSSDYHVGSAEPLIGYAVWLGSVHLLHVLLLDWLGSWIIMSLDFWLQVAYVYIFYDKVTGYSITVSIVSLVLFISIKLSFDYHVGSAEPLLGYAVQSGSVHPFHGVLIYRLGYRDLHESYLVWYFLFNKFFFLLTNLWVAWDFGLAIKGLPALRQAVPEATGTRQY